MNNLKLSNYRNKFKFVVLAVRNSYGEIFPSNDTSCNFA